MRDLHNLKDFYMAELREYFFESFECFKDDPLSNVCENCTECEDDFNEWLSKLTIKEIREITGDE
jgi:hypothetical protein